MVASQRRRGVATVLGRLVASGRKIAVMAALIGNLLIALAKLAGALVSGSASMFAESAHSFSDVGNQILLLIGVKRSGAPPPDKQPFGTGKAAYFWPLMVAVLLFGVAGAYSLIEGVEGFRHPHHVDNIKLSLAVFAVAFVIEAGTPDVASQQARKAARADGLTRKQWMKENRDA
jgi:cation diffusion facilitator family transporter